MKPVTHFNTRRAFIAATGFGGVSLYGLWAAYGAATEAREFVLQHGSILVMMVFPLTVLIMLLQILFDVDGDGHAVETLELTRGHLAASEVTRDQVHPDHHDRLPLRWG